MENLMALYALHAPSPRAASEDLHCTGYAPARVRARPVAGSVVLGGFAAAALAILPAPAAHAAVELVQVSAACGTMAEVHELLAVNMPHPEPIGKGGDSHGQDLVVLFTGTGYWALVAKLSADRVCVVASGRNWTAVVPGEAEAF